MKENSMPDTNIFFDSIKSILKAWLDAFEAFARSMTTSRPPFSITSKAVASSSPDEASLRAPTGSRMVMPFLVVW